MNGSRLIQIPKRSSERIATNPGSIFLAKPPFFTPWTPPLGIAVLKSYLEQQKFKVRCFDYNTDPLLWDTHHKYFATVQALEDISMNDGYTRLWWILNAHMLAYVNRAGLDGCARVLEKIIPLYGLKHDPPLIQKLNAIVEAYFKRLDEMTDQLSLSGYSVAGTSTYSTSLASSLFILRKIKETYPQIKTVMGGGVFADDLALGADNLETLLAQYPFVDHVILGEGELLFQQLLEGHTNERVISMGSEKKTLDMKEVVTPDFSDFESGFYYHLTIEGARSCPFQCSFCSETVQWGEYRKKPAGLLADQVTYLAKRYNNNAFFMGDSLMNPYIVYFARELLKRKANILYDGYLRADKPVTRQDWVKEWAQSGLYRVRMGIESAAGRVLEAMDKMTTPAVISGALKTLASQGIRTTTYWIAGFPGETEDDFSETLEFIREHHRYIYELEAHPYYYYPYGQIGSRLYESYSLYPDEVTDIIKFKVWDICNANPTREVRYQRLSRMCKLASELGLPNIYTLEDRYQAEERWHSLQPLAREVFEGTRLNREPATVSGTRVCFFDSGYASSSPQSNLESIVAYHMTAGAKLDHAVLSASIQDLIRYNEALQLSIQAAGFNASIETAPGHENELLFVYPFDNSQPDAAEAMQVAMRELSVEMEPKPGRSIRVALFEREQGESDIFLLVHRSVADARGATLLCEDLYRIYMQRSHGMDICLPPVQKNLSAFASEPPSSPIIKDTKRESSFVSNAVGGADAPVAQFPKIESRTFRVDCANISSSSLTQCGWSIQEVLAAALIKCFASSGLGMDTGIDLALDIRWGVMEILRTVGPFTRVIHLPPEDIKPDQPLSSLIHSLRQAASSALTIANSEGYETAIFEKAELRPLLSLERLVEPPWFGSDAWIPKGFFASEGSKRWPHSVVAEVYRDGSDMRILFWYETTKMNFVTRFEANLPSHIESIEADADHYARGMQYWSEKFKTDCPDSPIGSAVRATGLAGWESVDFTVNEALLSSVLSTYESTESLALLAAVSALLSRLSGREDVIILGQVESDEGPKTVPLRFYPRWSMTVREFVHCVGKEMTTALGFYSAALDFLTGKPGCQQEFHQPVFDVGYVYGLPVIARVDAVGEGELKKRAAARDLHLAVCATRDSSGLAVQVRFDRSRLERKVVEGFAAHLERTLGILEAEPDILIGDLAFEGASADQLASVRLAGESFSF
jgi:radical SAM superfamily enzyme YgiQ (UPF0313 family)